ncbi:rab-GTPase-TBC domain-containing protein [Lineolata rhizophorae]|uniref:Rab-GTPase-TBC domain-containing protein n=1 Tax=Lineolata rhizophorae TaxID=578093 RepID=A0A6A6P1T8_9PEZI|nr:rab-GTPase-TBC domain-containing protein [Lineolata rhizophorae]
MSQATRRHSLDTPPPTSNRRRRHSTSIIGSQDLPPPPPVKDTSPIQQHEFRSVRSSTNLSTYNSNNNNNSAQQPPVSSSPSITPAPATRTLPTASAPAEKPVPRDRYGFKKANQHITLSVYEAWAGSYISYVERRRAKWILLMKSYGLPTVNPERFPPKSDKVKRYVRKGIPPEWRGAAWFYFAGGPARLAQSRGAYWECVERARAGELSGVDRDDIERDLNRAFPDNVRFKPDAPGWDQREADDDGQPGETSIVRALRRVLQAFAVANPRIGYCQSLNFLAGLLLLFLDEDEEKAFIMLGIVTNEHLPGTHDRSLKNIDIGVLMSCIQESMPAVWVKIDDTQEYGSLPTVSLALTSWFMSCFVGSLPIETVLRVWDSFFYEGSKTLFRIALAIFKLAEPDIRRLSDPMEVFQVVQNAPRRLVDANALLEACFRRRNGFGHLSQETIDVRRRERARAFGAEKASRADLLGVGEESGAVVRSSSRGGGRFKRSLSRRRAKT